MFFVRVSFPTKLFSFSNLMFFVRVGLALGCMKFVGFNPIFLVFFSKPSEVEIANTLVVTA